MHLRHWHSLNPVDSALVLRGEGGRWEARIEGGREGGRDGGREEGKEEEEGEGEKQKTGKYIAWEDNQSDMYM